MGISPIRSKNINEQVKEGMIEQIRSGAWLAGDRIPGELELADQFQVSRVSVRQAISQLVGQGMLTVKRGEGTFVNEVKPQNYFENLRQLMVMDMPEYLEVQNFRLMFEPSIAYYLAENVTEESISLLQQCVDAQQRYLDEENEEAYMKEDFRFHRLLAETSGNSLVMETMTMVQDLMGVAMEHTQRITGYDDGVTFHQKILEQIRARNPKKAAAVMRKHIQNNIRSYNKYKRAKKPVKPTQ